MPRVEHLHKLPEHNRKRIALTIAGGVTGILAVVWVTTLGPRLLAPADIEGKDQKGPFASIVEDITELISELRGTSEFSIENNFMSFDDPETLEYKGAFGVFDEKTFLQEPEESATSSASSTDDGSGSGESSTTTATTSPSSISLE